MSIYDWDKIKIDFETITSKEMTIREMAKKHGVKSPSAITKKAKKNGWKRKGNRKQKKETGNSVSKTVNSKIEKKKVGRPPKFTKDIANEICEKLSVGESLISICRSDHIPDRVTVYKWLSAGVKLDADKNMVEFLNKYTRARELQADSFFDEAIDIADFSENDTITKEDRQGNEYETVNHEAIQRSRLRVDTRFKVAAISRPKKYSEKRIMELTGKDGGPIETKQTSMTLEEIEKEMKERGIPIPNGD